MGTFLPKLYADGDGSLMLLISAGPTLHVGVLGSNLSLDLQTVCLLWPLQPWGPTVCHGSRVEFQSLKMKRI